MTERLDVREIEDIREAGGEDLRALHDLMVEMDAEVLPDDPRMPFEEFMADIRSLASYIRPHWWLARREPGGKLIGASVYRARYAEDNKHMGRLGVWVRISERRKGLGSRLLRLAAGVAKADGRSLMEGGVVEGGAGIGFADALGTKHTISGFQNRTVVGDVDREMLGEWVRRAEERATDYSLVFFEGPCLEEWLVRFADLRTVMNTAPRSESEEDEIITADLVREWDEAGVRSGYTAWTLIAQHDPTGEWAGYTRIWPSPYRREFAYQDDTGVRPEHRNRGLGKWVKATMFLKLVEERPDTRWIETGNATTNEPMLAINRAMGFKPVAVWQQREIGPDELLERLSRRG